MKELSDRIMNVVRQDELINMLLEIVSIPSYKGVENQETEVAKYIKSVFDKEGIECYIEEVADGRCNVIATLRGTGGGKTLLLNGHTDTVPPNDMDRALEPFIKDGRIFGRGTSDMKGPIVSMMGAMVAIKRLNLPLKGNIIFTGVLDEENNSIGTLDLVDKGIKADGAIVGEPTELHIATAHRGLEWFEFKFIGKTVHGGKQKEGINAIAKAVDFINALEEHLIPKLAQKKHPILEEATLNYGVIKGGTQSSTVAGECILQVDRRWLPDETYEGVIQEFKDIIDMLSLKDKDFKCEMKVTEESLMRDGYIHDAMEIDVNHPLVELAHTTASKVLDYEVNKTLFPAWTDGALLSKHLKIPTLIMGPGEVEVCHSNVENISIDQLLKATIIYSLVAIEFCN